MARERIMVTLQGDEKDRPTVEAAARMARGIGATLDGLFVEPDASAYLMWTGPGVAAATVMAGAVDSIREESDRGAEEAKQTFSSVLSGFDNLAAEGRFYRVSGTVSEVAVEARLARYVVTDPQSMAGNGPLADFITAVLIDEQVPVIAARAGMMPPETIHIAWDGSKEAARAAVGAAPLIANAKRVMVLQSDKGIDYSDRRSAPPERLIDWLADLGCRAGIIEIDDAGDVGEAILDSSKGADLIVAGAYGHSRLREFVFGGVTRSLFQAVDGPSLLAAH